MLLRTLPAALMLTRLGTSDAPFDAEPDEAHATVQGRLIEALLGDALLTVDDLPYGWREAEASEDRVLAGHELDGLVLGSLRRAFEFVATGERIEHEVAVLPRWAVRHLGDESREQASDAPVFELRHAGGTAVAVAAPRIAASGTPLDVVRFGTVVSAIAHDAPAVDARISAGAERKCEQMAKVLR